MANKSTKNEKTPERKSSGKTPAKQKDTKPSFFSRVKSFFRGLKNELKLVVWPDKKTVRQTTLAVLVIVALTTILIFIVDSLSTGVLSLAGFNVAPATPTAPTTVQTTAAATEGETGITTVATDSASTTAGN